MAVVNRALQKTVGPRFFWNNVAGVCVALLAVLTTLTFFFSVKTYFYLHLCHHLPPASSLSTHSSHLNICSSSSSSTCPACSFHSCSFVTIGTKLICLKRFLEFLEDISLEKTKKNSKKNNPSLLSLLSSAPQLRSKGPVRGTSAAHEQ